MITEMLTCAAITLTCSHDGCGIVFSVPRAWRDERLEDHKTWYCPNGHTRWFPPGSSDLEKEQARAASLERQLATAREQSAQHYAEKQRIRRRLSATQGVVTRTRKRVGHGVCPCCRRSFAALRRHMQARHPDYAASEEG